MVLLHFLPELDDLPTHWSLIRVSRGSTQIVDPDVMTSVMRSRSHNISGQISQKLLQIVDTFLLGVYRKVAKGRRLVTSPMT